MSDRIRATIRNQWAGLLALFLVLSGGTALATHPGGANTISSGDIINGQVLSADLANLEVKTDDLAPGAVNAAKVLDDSLRSIDVRADTLTDADLAASSQFNGAGAGGDLTGSYPSPTLRRPEEFHLVGTAGEPNFQNFWTNAADGTPAGFYRDPLGRVYLKGRISGGQVGGNKQAWSLPLGYMPDYDATTQTRLDFAVPTDTGFGRVQIEEDGLIGDEAFVDIEVGGNGFVSLDGISFRCAPSGSNGCP